MAQVNQDQIYNNHKAQKNAALFPEIGRVKIVLLPTARISRMCMRTYIFCFKKHTHKQKSSH